MNRPASALLLCAICAAALGSACGSSSKSAAPTVQVVSTRPEYVSGGDALVDVAVPGGAGALRAELNGADVTSAFKQDPANAGHMLGLVTGLKDGANTLTVSTGGDRATLTMTNYPSAGPIVSGPHLEPWICQTEQFKLPDGTTLGAPTDPTTCSAPTKVTYLYRSTAGGALKPLANPTTLPSDVATTTTTAGAAVPFVVRVETGTVDRGIYQNAVLHDPTTDPPPSPTTPPKGWNRRLLAQHGGGCTGGWYIQGPAMGVDIFSGDDLTRLGEGYAIFISTLNHPTNSCNPFLAGEVTMMNKEHFIETFGVPRYTVSTGCSGGAYTSLQVADEYPGLFDGILISCTFPDALSIATSALDSKLLAHYLNGTTNGAPNNGAGFTEPQMVAVSGFKNARAWYDLALQSGRTDPVPNRAEPAIPPSPNAGLGGYKSSVWTGNAVPASQRYDPTTNPTGARPTIFDVARNVYGVAATTHFALRPYDNVGVQYGLAELNAGAITKAQFLDLNEKIGGYDADGNYTATRTTGDTGAIQRADQTGVSLGGGGGLSSIPIIDWSQIYDEDQFYHYQVFHFAARDRVKKANGGDASNYVMWRGGAPISELLGAPTPLGTAITTAASTQGWQTFVKWMDAYTGDTSSRSQRDRMLANKPANAVDGCFTSSATPQFVAEPQTLSSDPTSSQCNGLWPSWTLPRIQAGGPISSEVLKCTLKPVDAADYKVTFTQQELDRLKAMFPNGVCDWTKSGVGQTAVVPYTSVGPSPVKLIQVPH